MNPGIVAVASATLPGESIWGTIGVVLAMVAVIAGAYYFTLFIGKRAAGTGGKSRIIRVIDRHVFSKDRQIVLINVGEKTYLIGITNQEIRILDESVALPREVLDNTGQNMTPNFTGVLARAAGIATGAKDFFIKKPKTACDFTDFIHETEKNRNEKDLPSNSIADLEKDAEQETADSGRSPAKKPKKVNKSDT